MAARPRLAEPEPTANVRVFEDVDEAYRGRVRS